jgi:hypothetical protein
MKCVRIDSDADGCFVVVCVAVVVVVVVVVVAVLLLSQTYCKLQTSTIINLRTAATVASFLLF